MWSSVSSCAHKNISLEKDLGEQLERRIILPVVNHVHDLGRTVKLSVAKLKYFINTHKKLPLEMMFGRTT